LINRVVVVVVVNFDRKSHTNINTNWGYWKLKMTALKKVPSNCCFGRYHKVFSHDSKERGYQMNFSIYLSPQAEDGKVPFLY
jgi:hypothetical protein